MHLLNNCYYESGVISSSIYINNAINGVLEYNAALQYPPFNFVKFADQCLDVEIQQAHQLNKMLSFNIIVNCNIRRCGWV